MNDDEIMNSRSMDNVDFEDDKLTNRKTTVLFRDPVADSLLNLY